MYTYYKSVVSPISLHSRNSPPNNVDILGEETIAITIEKLLKIKIKISLNQTCRQITNTNLGRHVRAVGGGGLGRMYHERVLDHSNNPRNVGSFDKNDPDVGTGLVGAPACGDVIKLQIRVDDATGKIVDVCFKVYGCGSAIGAGSATTEWVKGKPIEEALKIKNTDIAKYLSLPPVKQHCSMLAEDAIKAAVKDYDAKRTKVNGSREAAPVEKAADA